MVSDCSVSSRNGLHPHGNDPVSASVTGLDTSVVQNLKKLVDGSSELYVRSAMMRRISIRINKHTALLKVKSRRLMGVGAQFCPPRPGNG